MNDDRICRDCNAPFFLSENEALFFAQRGLDSPKRCKACRLKRRAERQQEQTREQQ